MTQTVNVTEPLTVEERQKVEAFAESLIANRAGGAAGHPPRRINVDALYGMFAGLGGDRSEKELIRDAWDDALRKYDR